MIGETLQYFDPVVALLPTRQNSIKGTTYGPEDCSLPTKAHESTLTTQDDSTFD